jgi:hypothetical protein
MLVHFHQKSNFCLLNPTSSQACSLSLQATATKARARYGSIPIWQSSIQAPWQIFSSWQTMYSRNSLNPYLSVEGPAYGLRELMGYKDVIYHLGEIFNLVDPRRYGLLAIMGYQGYGLREFRL